MTRWLLDVNLRLSFSSELGAALAYEGFARWARTEVDRAAIAEVHRDELRHREELGRMMAERGVRPFPPFEWLFTAIGSCVALGCRFWGDWASALGAAWFEVNGVSEYRRLAALARASGEHALLPSFAHMEAQEALHRDRFRAMAGGRSLPG